jgi:hypothetical protein
VSHPVSTGPSDLTRTVILSGVNPGDKVIIGPFKALLTLKDGQSLQEESAAPKVAPEQASPAATPQTPPAEEKPAADKSEGDAAAPKQEAGTR